MCKPVPSYKYRDKKWFYLLINKLKTGHDGTTWLAKRKEVDLGTSLGQTTGIRRRYFCVKQFPLNRPAPDGNTEMRNSNEEELAQNRVINEMVTLSCMKDKKCVQEFEEFVRTDNNLWLVQPFYNGGNLAEMIAKHPDGLEPEYARKIMKQIVDGVGLLLERDFLQVDLKPDNIMLHYQQDHLNSSNDETPPKEQMNNFKTNFDKNIDSIEVKLIDFSNV